MHSKSVYSKVGTARFLTEADGITLYIGESSGLEVVYACKISLISELPVKS